MGKSVTILSLYIALPLCLSQNTIRTHQLHVHGSLNVCYAHSVCVVFVVYISYYCIYDFFSFSCFMLPPICTSLCQTKLSGRQTLDLLVVTHHTDTYYFFFTSFLKYHLLILCPLYTVFLFSSVLGCPEEEPIPL